MDLCRLESLNIALAARECEDYFERFEIWWLTRKDLKEDKKTVNFLAIIGKEAYSLIKNLAFPEPPVSLSFEAIKELLLRHLQPINFEAAERARFHSLQRREQQDIRPFILELQTQAARCNFGDQLQVQLRDRLIAGINNPNLQRKLLLLKDATFQSARNVCELYNDVQFVVKEDAPLLFNSTNSLRTATPKLRNFESQCHSNNTMSENTTEDNTRRMWNECKSCGRKHSRLTCKFRNSKCYNCGKIGHVKTVCRSTKSCLVHKEEPTESVADDFDSLALSTNMNPTSGHLWRSFIVNKGPKHSFIIDTGSVESFVPLEFVKGLQPAVRVYSTTVSVKGITGHPLTILGRCDLKLQDSSGISHVCHFLVINGGISLIGLKVMTLLGISLSLSTVCTENSVKDLILRCSKVTGGMNIQPVSLAITGDPIFIKRRVISFGLRDAVHNALLKLIEKGVLSPVSCSNWATPIVTPLKRDGRTPRICGDYRITLNKCLLRKTCTTEEPEDILHRLVGSKYFSKLDLKDAYLQIPLDKNSSMLTTINTPFGLFKYNFLPFGLSVSPAIFQDVMNMITAGLRGVAVYQDDIIVHGANPGEHDERLCALLEKFHSYNVAINPEKCTFRAETFSCLGYLVNADGFKPDPERFSLLSDAASPKTLDELRSLMGSLQYYSRFIPSFARKAESLFSIISSNQFIWTDEHEHTLRSLLQFLATDAVLRPFSPQLKSTVITDASPTGIGAVLEQEGHPVLCISRRLSPAERGYSQTQREALAVYWAVTRLHKYLFGCLFTIISDHSALQYIYHPDKSLAKTSAAMVQRWSIALSAYTYDVQYRSAKQIQHADYLSRHASSCDTDTSDCLLVQPLPVSRTALIADTRKYFHSVMTAVSKGWNSMTKRKFPQLFARREDLGVTPDGILCLNDRIIVPPTLKKLFYWICIQAT